MKYGPAEVSRDLTLIHQGTADFETRARLEHELLKVLQSKGLDALTALLQSFPDHRFEDVGAASGETARCLISPGPDSADLVVEATLNASLATLNVSVGEGESAPPPHPYHEAFYTIWEGLLGISDAERAQLEPAHRAVYLVGLLESEVMNGGLGQYLANSEGAHVEETLACLDQIGASQTRSILVRAAALGAEFASFGDAWDEKSSDLERLDTELFEAGEDLARLTASTILNVA